MDSWRIVSGGDDKTLKVSLLITRVCQVICHALKIVSRNMILAEFLSRIHSSSV